MCNYFMILVEAPSGPADLFGFNLDNFLATIKTFDSSTLYTTIPHEQLKSRLKWPNKKFFHL